MNSLITISGTMILRVTAYERLCRFAVVGDCRGDEWKAWRTTIAALFVDLRHRNIY
jgi:hypothetical protein